MEITTYGFNSAQNMADVDEQYVSVECSWARADRDSVAAYREWEHEWVKNDPQIVASTIDQLRQISENDCSFGGEWGEPQWEDWPDSPYDVTYGGGSEGAYFWDVGNAVLIWNSATREFTVVPANAPPAPMLTGFVHLDDQGRDVDKDGHLIDEYGERTYEDEE